MITTATTMMTGIIIDLLLWGVLVGSGLVLGGTVSVAVRVGCMVSCRRVVVGESCEMVAVVAVGVGCMVLCGMAVASGVGCCVILCRRVALGPCCCEVCVGSSPRTVERKHIK